VTNQSTAAPDRGLTNSMLGIFVDPARFTELPVFHKEIAGILKHVKASPAAQGVKEVLTAGEPERIAHADRTANGIPIHDGTWREIGAAAASVGVDLDRFV
jgi:uncharacterized oxidoreductase